MKKYFINLIVCVLLLFGCSKSGTNTITNHKLSSTEIQSILNEIGVSSYISFFADGNYALPSENWIKEDYSLALYSYLSSFKSSQWVSEENDCDNFASMAFSFAQILHHNTPKKLDKTSLAFGEFWYVKDDNSGHAINVVIVYSNEGKYKVLFYEPQTQKTIILSKEEIKSCTFYRF